MTLENKTWLERFFAYNDKNINISIMVKFVWVALVCCGIANGLIYSYVASPTMYLYMLVVALLCCVLLVIHNHSTKKWCKNREKEEENMDYDEDHFPLFLNSTLLAFVLMLIACVVGSTACIIAMVTMLISFMIAALREALYS